MKIQLWHARDSDFQAELYTPLKGSSFFHEHEWILPHDWEEVNSRESLKTVDIFIAEVSHGATWLGIELGFASLYGKKILCIYKKWSHISSSLKYLIEDFIEYDDSEDMVSKVWEFLRQKAEPSKKKMYIGCALTHASPEFRDEIAGFKDLLRPIFDILDSKWVIDGWTISATEIYEHDRSCVLACDIFVAECSYPSTGLGYEIATAVEYGKAILLIAHEDAVVTRMILGIPQQKATFLRYRSLEEVRSYIQNNYL